MLSIVILSCAEQNYAECTVCRILMLSVVMLRVITVSVVMVTVIMLSATSILLIC